MNLVFRDDSSGHELHQMNGVIAANDDGSIRMELTNADSSVCLVKAGPVQKERYEYIVLAETDGTERCRIYHIYARNAEEFIKTHYDTIARFMKEEVLSGDALPVAALPKPHHCQSTS
ncbi:unnamed protein product [Toxocara canis]|uniref:Cadherin domain-containing protein n=1 Tax=Toxocara canis TaxID=6265 RepID=A0A183U3W0_TOXCA|nr:unnamed protein product [Toxocara canis]